MPVLGIVAAIRVVVTAASSLVVAVRMYETHARAGPADDARRADPDGRDRGGMGLETEAGQ